MVNLDDKLIDELNESELFLLLKVARYMRFYRMTAWPSLATLAARCNWEERTVKKWRKSLLQKKLLDMEDRPGKSPIYRFRCKIGLYYGLEDQPFEEEDFNENQGGAKNVPPTKNVPPHPPQKMYPEDIDYSLEDIDLNTISKPAKKSVKKKEVTPGPGGENIPKKMAEMFDDVLNEKEGRAFVWKAGEGRNFANLKTLRKMIEDEITKAGKVELTTENFEMAYRYVLSYGYDYLHTIAKKAGGATEFKPSALVNNYNSIINHARTANKGSKRTEAIRNAATTWNEYDND